MQAAAGELVMRIGASQDIVLNTKKCFDVSRLICEDTLTRSFDLPKSAFNLLCSVDGGASVNCYSISNFVPHSSMTHTESIGHIDSKITPISDIIPHIPVLMPCLLVSVTPSLASSGDLVLDDKCIAEELYKMDSIVDPIDAIMIRTLPNSGKNRDFSGTNPPYFTESGIQYIIEKINPKHLLVDLPSVDREDSKSLLAHKKFLDREVYATITELCFIPDEIHDGSYVLNLQVLKMSTDCSPSRPVLISTKH